MPDHDNERQRLVPLAQLRAVEARLHTVQARFFDLYEHANEIEKNNHAVSRQVSKGLTREHKLGKRLAKAEEYIRDLKADIKALNRENDEAYRILISVPDDPTTHHDRHVWLNTRTERHAVKAQGQTTPIIPAWKESPDAPVF